MLKLFCFTGEPSTAQNQQNYKINTIYIINEYNQYNKTKEKTQLKTTTQHQKE